MERRPWKIRMQRKSGMVIHTVLLLLIRGIVFHSTLKCCGLEFYTYISHDTSDLSCH